MSAEFWSRLWSRTLREVDPTTYLDLERSGRLDEMARGWGESAEEEYEATLHGLKQLYPLPEGYEERVQQLMVLQSMARESVVESILPRAPEE